MGKNKPSKPPPAAAVAPTSTGSSWLTLAGGVAVAAIGLAVRGNMFASSASSPAETPRQREPARRESSSARAVADLGPGELAGFSAEHNASLLWGTYRPGVYFGLRSRTYPTAVVAGLMWGALAHDGLELRHACEQGQVQKYGFTEHDGESYATQPIVDGQNGVELQTSFVKPEAAEAAGAWAARIEGRPLPGQDAGAPIALFFYVGVDGGEGGEGGAAATLGKGELGRSFAPAVGAHVTGDVPGVGPFSLLASGWAEGHGLAPHVWGGAGDEEGSFLRVREVALEQLAASEQARSPLDLPSIWADLHLCD